MYFEFDFIIMVMAGWAMRRTQKDHLPMDLQQDWEFEANPIIVVVASVFLNLRIGSKSRIDLLCFDTF